MEMKVVELDNKEYYVVKEIKLNNLLYYILINTEDNSDFQIRKIVEENGEILIVGLDDEKEFYSVMGEYNKNKILPIGTVCKLTGGKKRVMITGYFVKNKDDSSKFYDYSGCGFPEGVISTKVNLVFNHNQIEVIEKMGYEDEKSIEFSEKLSKAKQQLLEQSKSGNLNE